MADYDAVVIGAGNGGLTSALTLAKAGVKTLLLERHNIPGGCATSFFRGRFEFEVALHQLSGVGTKTFPGPLTAMLKDLGVFGELGLVEQKNLYRAVYPGELDITLKADRAQATAALKERFPKEAEHIDRFFDFLYLYCNQWVHTVIMRDPESSKSKYPEYYRYALVPLKKVLDDYFADPLLQMVISIYWSYIGLPPDQLPFGEFAITLWAYLEFKPYHIKGGSQALSNALLNAFLKAGGDVRFNCGVQKIKVKNQSVSAVVTDDGDTIQTLKIVSNAGLLTTYVDLIDDGVVPENRMRELGTKTVGVSAATLYMGFDQEPQDLDIPAATNFILTSMDPNQAYKDFKSLNPPHYMLFSCFDVDDPDFSAKGTSQAAFLTLSYAQPWLAIPPHQYFDKKYEYAQGMLNVLDKVFPKCRPHIEEIDVATPLTHMRYLGHPGGAIYGFESHAKDSDLFFKKNSPIKGLYHAGSWAGLGGFQPTLTSGTSVARAVIRSLGKK